MQEETLTDLTRIKMYLKRREMEKETVGVHDLEAPVDEEVETIADEAEEETIVDEAEEGTIDEAILLNVQSVNAEETDDGNTGDYTKISDVFDTNKKLFVAQERSHAIKAKKKTYSFSLKDFLPT